MLDKLTNSLRLGFCHFHKKKKTKKFDTFLYHQLKNNGHSPSKIISQPVEKKLYMILVHHLD